VNTVASVGVLGLVAQLMSGIGDGHGQESAPPKHADQEPSPQSSRHPCPVNLALTKDQLGCWCGEEGLHEKHFKTLTLLRSNTRFVLVCKDNQRIGVLPPAFVR